MVREGAHDQLFQTLDTQDEETPTTPRVREASHPGVGPSGQ